MSATRTYELIYILKPDSSEQQVAEIHTQVEAVVRKFAGTIQKTENWGRKRMAYDIGRHSEGIYVLELIDATGDIVKELDRRLKVSDTVIRHLVVRVDEDTRVAERRQAERRDERARRRAARGLPPEPETPVETAVESSDAASDAQAEA
ncbi:MAG: 30S ribosomal protein S6 [Vicinamibacterales bacterium]